MATQNIPTRRSSTRRSAKPQQRFVQRYVVEPAPRNMDATQRMIDTKAPIRDQFNFVFGNELAALLWYMTWTGADEVAFTWSPQQRKHAYRYMRQLTHGADAIQVDTSSLTEEDIDALLDCSSLTEEQVGAIRTIFQVLCAFEDSRMLTRTWLDSMHEVQYQAIILPGMETDWYTEGYEEILDWIKDSGADIRSISHASRFLAEWRKTAFKKEVVATKVTTDKVMVDA